MVTPKYIPDQFDIISSPGGTLSWCVCVIEDEIILAWFGRRYGEFKVGRFPRHGQNRRFYKNNSDPIMAISIIKNEKDRHITVEDIHKWNKPVNDS